MEEIRTALEEAKARFREAREAGATLAELAGLVAEVRRLREELAAAESVAELEAELAAEAEQEEEPEAPAEMAAADEEEPVEHAADEAGATVGPSPSVGTMAPLVSVSPRRRSVIVAGADLPHFSAGTEMPDLTAVGRAFADKAEAMRRGLPAKALVASFRIPVAEGIRNPEAASENGALLASAVEGWRSLVASGGFCAPEESLYDFLQIHSAERPLLAGLPMTPAPRGRIRFVPPHVLSDTAAGVTKVTGAQDATGATKGVVSITCPAERTAEVQAIALRVRVGNFDRMTFPEHFENFFQTALAQHARVAERALLDAIDTSCTAVTDGRNLGAARDLLEALGRQAAARRDAFRMGADASVIVVMRSWVRDMIRADLAREAPGSAQERLAVADAEIDRFFAVRNIRVVWTLEGRTDGGQDFAAQGAGASLPWPSVVEAHMFHPGAFVVLEAPQLDLGVEIRDSALNAQNDVEAFLEIFEGVAYRGLWATRLRMNVCVSGEAAALATAVCTGS